jgi:uncharacterized protein (DUF2147 family)
MKYAFSIALCFLFLIGITETSSAQKFKDDDLVGVWEPSHGKARVKIEKIGDKYYGKVVWLKEPIDHETGERKTDKNNPDPALQIRKTLGLKILKNFTGNGKGYWDKGTIYDPENGTTYNCHITMKNKNTIEIRGYVGVSVFGRTDVWKRLQ